MNGQVEKKRQLIDDGLRSIWFPFTQMQEFSPEDVLVIAEGKGALLRDVDGRDYIDGVSSLWTNVHGHRKEQIDRAIKEQVDRVAHSTLLGLAHEPAIECAKKLLEIVPKGLTRVFYSESGSTAVEIALKMAFQYQKQAAGGNPGKTRFISFTNAYHGDTLGAVSVGGIDLFHAVYGELLFPTIKAESPYCYRCPFGASYPVCKFDCLRQLEYLLATHASELAALIIEPLVQGAAGILVQPPGYLKRIRELCTQYGVLMIADEVAVGFGKTGKMFACEQEGVTPDIMALGKGLSGGYLPLAATVATEEIYNGFLGRFDEFKTFFHGHTYTGNPLACAAAVANLNIFAEERVVEGLAGKIKRLTQGLQPIAKLGHVGEIRQRGFMVGIELVADKGTKELYPPGARIGNRVILEARKRGLIIRPLGDVIVLMPPLCITNEEIDRLCEITLESIQAVVGD
ncbi:adenosylmethionine-8-amino-7-oxononanoate aminotransferase [Syntrophus gentianae]|uniref:Adenosylmethionine-8-amino-7-oxononanoate aminotransferase n=1 Tax=Syntrophus gentianae TaxID=43775 RepID=A0A1H7UI02_9BACT|nr:adenosylmethionine--8-amino-7-oxononanoate transaminase [Syntrophus gentianae]SEL96268.1 adenosylmethionine-8-amino-7-oxononanoate aminotransferase [Syntrophus gentianae]